MQVDTVMRSSARLSVVGVEPDRRRESQFNPIELPWSSGCQSYSYPETAEIVGGSLEEEMQNELASHAEAAYSAPWVTDLTWLF